MDDDRRSQVERGERPRRESLFALEARRAVGEREVVDSGPRACRPLRLPSEPPMAPGRLSRTPRCGRRTPYLPSLGALLDARTNKIKSHSAPAVCIRCMGMTSAAHELPIGPRSTIIAIAMRQREHSSGQDDRLDRGGRCGSEAEFRYCLEAAAAPPRGAAHSALSDCRLGVSRSVSARWGLHRAAPEIASIGPNVTSSELGKCRGGALDQRSAAIDDLSR